MAGFDNGTVQQGLFAQAKQFGRILRGVGAPMPVAGVVGDVYIDAVSFLLYAKRSALGIDPWGNWLFLAPAEFRSGLNWFTSSAPTNDMGTDGDYCLLWGGADNYGVASIFGPKADGCWPESGTGPVLLLDPAYAGTTLPVGLTEEATAAVEVGNSWQVIVAGLTDEYILSIPVSQLPNTPIMQSGLASLPSVLGVQVNPLANYVNKVQV